MIIPIIVPMQSFPQYIKKVDLETYIQKQAKGAKLQVIFAISGLLLLQVIVGLLVMPKMYGLYTTLNKVPPDYLPFVVITSVIVGLTLILISAMSNFLDSSKVEKIKQDKEDLITINSSLVNKKLLFFFWGYAIIFLLTMALAIILPITGLTSSV